MRALAVEMPLAEPPVFKDITGFFADINAEMEKDGRLEKTVGMKISCFSKFRTPLKPYSGLPAPLEYRRTIFTEKEVGVALEFFKRSDVVLGFDFPSTEETQAEETQDAILKYNQASQLVICTLKRVAESFPPGNAKWFDLERGKGRRISFGYDAYRDIAALMFSPAMPDSFEEHPHIHGTIVLYSDNQLVGYEMVEFSEFYNSACRVPHLAIPR